MGYFDTKKFWFGTEEYSKWVDTPLMGASVSPTGWAEGGSFLSGGGYQFDSSGSHRLHTFEWRESSSYEAAQEMSDFANGAYGSGPIHFVLPTIYEKNILPPQWAAPATADSAAVFARGAANSPPSSLPTLDIPGRMPRMTRFIVLNDAPVGFRDGEYLFIPIPEGFDLALGAFGVSAGGAGVFTSPLLDSGAQAPPTRLTMSGWDISTWSSVYDRVSGAGLRGVRLWVGVDNPSGSTRHVSLLAMTARLIPAGAPLASIADDPWTGGMGNSGCKFVGKPTMNLHTGFDGGRASFAATLREIGSWLRR